MAHLKYLSRLGFIDDKKGRRNAEEYIEKLKIKTPGPEAESQEPVRREPAEDCINVEMALQ